MLMVTTSWDDGDVLDGRVVEILDRYELKGTFYIPQKYWGRRLTENEIRTISKRHEVGAHTLSHVDLSKVSPDIAQKEIEGSKQWLDAVCGKNTKMLCYPRGRYTPATRELVQKAGFQGARTTAQFSLSVNNPFEIPTTVQVYPFPLRMDAGVKRMLEPFMQRRAGYRSLDVSYVAMRSWEAAAKATFDTALKRGGVFHLWGHSWEIEKYGLWNEFDRVCAYIGKRADCTYVVNVELV